MTTEEHKSIIGGVVLEYAEVKQKLAALSQELQNKRLLLVNVEQALRLSEHEKLPGYLKDWPSAEYFTNTLSEIEQHRERKKALEQTMKQYGIDLP